MAEQSEVLPNDSQRATGWRENANQEWGGHRARSELKHIVGLDELWDIAEAEYHKARLGCAMFVSVWSSVVTTQVRAEGLLRESATLARTADTVVCDGLL